MGVSPKQAAAALRTYKENMPLAILRGMRKGLRVAERYAKTKYMERKDNRHPKVWDPPNPEPGPLGIRQANLVRTVTVAPMRFTGKAVIGGLRAGSADGRYAAIHEFGGMAGRNHASKIPPRPYLHPALADATDEIVASITKELRSLARATLRQVARVS
jgi:hypothetical protein